MEDGSGAPISCSKLVGFDDCNGFGGFDGFGGCNDFGGVGCERKKKVRQGFAGFLHTLKVLWITISAW